MRCLYMDTWVRGDIHPLFNSSMDSEPRRAWRSRMALLVSSNYSTVCTINKTLECISWIGNGISNFLNPQQRLGEYPPGTKTIICAHSLFQKSPFPKLNLSFNEEVIYLSLYNPEQVSKDRPGLVEIKTHNTLFLYLETICTSWYPRLVSVFVQVTQMVIMSEQRGAPLCASENFAPTLFPVLWFQCQQL